MAFSLPLIFGFSLENALIPAGVPGQAY